MNLTMPFLGVLRFLADLSLPDDHLVGGDEERRLVDVRQQGIGIGMRAAPGSACPGCQRECALIDVRGHYRERVPHRGQELPPPV
jgi:hypothetical protein